MALDCEEQVQELPEDYVPAETDVICGWAKQNYHHAGNRRLRKLIQECVPRYNDAKTKSDKGQVIVEILEQIRRDSESGVGMVKQDSQSGRWRFIGWEKSKDKIGHALRKATKESKKKKSQFQDARKNSGGTMQESASMDSLLAATLVSRSEEAGENRENSTGTPDSRPYRNSEDDIFGQMENIHDAFSESDTQKVSPQKDPRYHHAAHPPSHPPPHMPPYPHPHHMPPYPPFPYPVPPYYGYYPHYMPPYYPPPPHAYPPPPGYPTPPGPGEKPSSVSTIRKSPECDPQRPKQLTLSESKFVSKAA